jgi:hypothetical protein
MGVTSLPGFTAEASLSSADMRYRAIAATGSRRDRFQPSATRPRPGSTGSRDLDCAIKWAACTLKCQSKYPDDPLMRQGCDDACSASLRLCRNVRVGGGPVIL